MSVRQRPQARGRWLLTLVITHSMLALSVTCAAFAQSNSADEYAIRAAMVFNLARFIDWPPSKLDPEHPEFAICILGSDPIAVDLESVLKNKSVGTRPVVLRHLNSVDASNSCNMLYVGAGQRGTVARAAAQLARNAVVTVSDVSNTDNPAQVIGLPTLDEHVHIDVNLGAAQRSGVTISSRLLHLATVSR